MGHRESMAQDYFPAQKDQGSFDIANTNEDRIGKRGGAKGSVKSIAM